jgi:hypothetical protein
MEETNPKWKQAVEKWFKKEVKEEKMVASIPRERKGQLPSKEFEVMKHIKSCSHEEHSTGEGNKEAPPEK